MWRIIPQDEHVGEGEYESVQVKRLKGGKSRVMEEGRMVEKSFRFPNLMFKTLVDSVDVRPETDFMLPREIVFSQLWVSKKNGTKFVGGKTRTLNKETGQMEEVRIRPDTRFYFLRDKVTVKTVQRRYFKEERTGKRCVTKVTQRLPVDEFTNGAQEDSNGEFWVKHVIDQADFEVNDKDGEHHWDTMLNHLIETFGLDVASEFGETLLVRINEASE